MKIARKRIKRGTAAQPLGAAVLAAAIAAVGCRCAPVFAQDPAPAQDNAFEARITRVEGPVTVLYHDQEGDVGVPAEEGMSLEAGDSVKTEEQGRAEIGLDGDSVIELGPGTEFTVTSLDRGNSIFSLNLGSLLAKVRSLLASGGQMQVRAPTAVAAVRGTEFAVEAGARGESHVGVFDEGRVTVTGQTGGPIVVGPNEETSVMKGLPPMPPVALKRFFARRARMRALRGRVVAVRRRWRALPPARRRAVRRKILERRRHLLRRVRERRALLRRNR